MRGIIKAVSIADTVVFGLAHGVEVNPIRKGPHGDEWYCNLKALCVEDVHKWYTSSEYERDTVTKSYPMGTLLFFDFGEFSKGV